MPQSNIAAPAPILRPPWSATLASLVAFGALFYASRSTSYLLPTYAALLLASYLGRRRFGEDQTGRLQRNLAVMVVFVAGIGESLIRNAQTDTWVDPLRLLTLGEICAGVIVLEAWRAQPAGGPGAPNILALSVVIMMSACYTIDQSVPLLLSPVYAACLGLAFYAYRRRAAGPGGRLRWPAAAVRLAAVALALALGGGLYWTVTTFRSQIGALYAGINFTRAPFESGGGSTTPTLGRTFGQPGSTARVLVLRGYTGDPHLRGLAFDTYRIGTWYPAYSERAFRAARPEDVGAQALGPRARVSRLNGERGVLYAPLDAAGLDMPDSPQLEVDAGHGQAVRSEVMGPVDYDIVLPTAGSGRPLDRPPGRSRGVDYTEMPPDVGRVARPIAAELARSARSPEGRVQAVEAFLMGRHKYSLTTDPGPGDPLASFLASRRAAHCEYFASAAVMLLRAMGMEARYVTGYYAHEADGPDQTVVRARDAHAWAECWLPGRGWMTVEATPPSGRPDERAGPLPFWQRLREWFGDAWERVKNWLADMSPLQSMAMAVGALAVVFVAMLWSRKRRQRAAEAGVFRYTTPHEELAAMARRYEDLLRRTGHPLPEARPWTEHLADIQPNGLDPEAAARFVSAYNAARFGHHTDAGELARLREMLGRVESRESRV